VNRPLRVFLRDYEWVHVSLGLLGNVIFLAGSILFLQPDRQHVATWFFVAGATGMLINSIGSALIAYQRRVRGRPPGKGW